MKTQNEENLIFVHEHEKQCESEEKNAFKVRDNFFLKNLKDCSQKL